MPVQTDGKLSQRNELFSVFRFLFALGVVAFHYAPGEFKTTFRVFCAGSQFVTFFFLLSGYTCWLSASSSGEFNALRFVSRRLSKLAPLYYMALALTVAIFLHPSSLSWSTLRSLTVPLLASSLCVQSWIPPLPLTLNGAAWYVSCLVSFVLVFPVLFRYVTECRVRPWAFMAAALGCWAFTQVILVALLNNPSFYRGAGSVSHDLIYYSPLAHWCTFMLGAALGQYCASAARPRLRKWSSLALVAVALSCTAAALQFNWAHLVVLALPLGASFNAPLFGALVLSIALMHPDLARPFDNRLVRYLGRISFAVYILQGPVYELWAGYFIGHFRIPLPLPDQMSGFLLYLAALVLVSSVLQRLVQDRASSLLLSAVRRLSPDRWR